MPLLVPWNLFSKKKKSSIDRKCQLNHKVGSFQTMWQRCCDWRLSSEAHLQDLCCRAWIQFDHLGKLGWCCRRTPPQGIASCRRFASPLSAPNGATDTPLWPRHKRKQASQMMHLSLIPFTDYSIVLQFFQSSIQLPSLLPWWGRTSCNPMKSFQLQYAFF